MKACAFLTSAGPDDIGVHEHCSPFRESRSAFQYTGVSQMHDLKTLCSAWVKVRSHVASADFALVAEL